VSARTVTVTGIGDFRQLQAELERTGVISAQSTKSIQEGAATAGEAAAKQAEAMGASADEQEAAAGRAAAATITPPPGGAAAAAAAVAEASGASADEIVAASARAVEAQKALQSASIDTAAVADASGARIGTAFDEGTSKAGSALTKLGETGASWGIPFSGSLTKMGKQFDEADSKAEKFGSALASAGKLAVSAGLVGFGAAAIEGVKGAAALEKQMTLLRTQAGASTGQVKQLTGAILNMHVGTQPQVLAEGMYHVVSALNATTPAAERSSVEMKVLETAAKGAQVGNANLVDVTNALDAAVVSGLPGLGSYSHAMGALNSIVGAGDMTMQNLADALGTGLLGPMRNFGVSLQDIGGALAVFGDNNMRGAQAATKLSSAIRIMAAPSKTAAGYLAEVGISATELGEDIRSKGLVYALEDLKKHLVDSGETASQQMRTISNAFGGKQSTGMQVLLAQLDRLKDKVKEVSAGGDKFGMAWAERTHNLSYELDELKEAVTSDADKLGLFLIPKLQEAGKVTGEVIQWFEKNRAAAEALGLVVGGVLSAAVGAFAAQKAVAFWGGLQKMWSGMQTLASGVTGAVSTIVGRFAAQDEAVTATAGTTSIETKAIAGSYGAMSDAAAVAASDVEAANTAIVESADATADGVKVAEGSTGIGAVLVALGFAAVELEQHWGTVMKTMEEAAQEAANGIIKALNAAISVIETLSLGLLKISNINELSGAGEGGKGRKPGEGGKLAVSGTVMSKYGFIAERASAKYGIPSNVLLADIEQESGGVPVHSTGSTPGVGNLTQFLPGTAKEYGVKFGTSKADIESQIMGQAAYLKALGGQKNIKAALEGYNSGTPGDRVSEGYANSVLAKAGVAGNEAVAREVPKLGKEAQIEEEKRRAEAERAKLEKEVQADIHGGKGTPEPLTAAQEKAKEKAEEKAEKAKSKAEELAERAAREAKEHTEKITSKGESLLKKYEQDIQNGLRVSTMENALGISTTGRFRTIPGAARMAAQTGRLGGLEGELGKSAAASVSGREEQTLIKELKATHNAGLEKLARELTAAHREMLATLAAEMVATEQLKLGESLKIQATEEKDRTTQLEHTATDQLNIVKAEQAQQTDAMKAAASAIGDATQSMSDSFTALSQSIEDQTKVMADSSNAVVTGIKDQTNIEVAVLGERGLYGLNLIAQKEEVQLDQMKATYDQQIQQAKIAEDQLAATWQGTIAQDQQIVDEDKTQADVQEAKAQAHADAMQLLGAQQIAAAQAEVDAVQLAQDAKIGNAELKVLAAANASKEKQTLAASGLSFAEHEAEHQEAAANNHLKAVEAGANTMSEEAARAMENVTNTWNEAIKSAEQAMAQAKGESAVALAKASQALQAIEDKAAQEEAGLEKEISVTKERATTQYAGSGLNVNFYGMNPEDAAANASALGWELRSLLPV
jgi:hypothetical protein